MTIAMFLEAVYWKRSLKNAGKHLRQSFFLKKEKNYFKGDSGTSVFL